MLTTVKGTFKNGQITLEKKPDIEEEVQVIITFLEKREIQKSKRIIGSMKGLFKVPEDFDEPLDDLKDYM